MKFLQIMEYAHMQGRLCRRIGSAIRPLDNRVYSVDTEEGKIAARLAIARAKIGLEPELFPDAHEVNLYPQSAVSATSDRIGDTLLSRLEAARVEGYWRPSDEMPPSDKPCQPYEVLPWPAGADRPWPGRDKFLSALARVERSARGVEKHRYMGYSTCRLCGRMNGTAEYFDPRPNAAHGWRWPEGLAHYVEAHNVEPSNAFLNYIMWRSLNLSVPG